MANQPHLTQIATISESKKGKTGTVEKVAEVAEEKKARPLELGAFVMVPLAFFQGQYTELTTSELRVLLYIFYRTLGYRDPLTGGRKVKDAISHSQFLKGITRRSSGEQLDQGAGVSERSLDRALGGLEEKGFIRRQPRTDRTGRCLATVYELNLEGAGANWLATDAISSNSKTNLAPTSRNTSSSTKVSPTSTNVSAFTAPGSLTKATVHTITTAAAPVVRTSKIAASVASENTPTMRVRIKEESVENHERPLRYNASAQITMPTLSSDHSAKPLSSSYVKYKAGRVKSTHNSESNISDLPNRYDSEKPEVVVSSHRQLDLSYNSYHQHGTIRSLPQPDDYSRKIAGMSRVKLRETTESLNKKEESKTTQMCVSTKGNTHENLVGQAEKQALELELVEAGITRLEARHLAELAHVNGHHAGSDGYVKTCLAYIGRQQGVKNRIGLLVYLVKTDWQPGIASPDSTYQSLTGIRSRLLQSWQKYGVVSGETAISDTDALLTSSTGTEIGSEIGAENPVIPPLSGDLSFEVAAYGELPTAESCHQAWLRVCQKAVREWGVSGESLVGSWLVPAAPFLTGAPYAETNFFLHLSDPASLASVRYRFSQQIRQELGLGLEWKILDLDSSEAESIQTQIKTSLAG